MNAGAVEKLLHRIEDVKEALARRKDAAVKEAFEEVRKAEQMFLDALAEKGMRFEKGKIIGANEEDTEQVKKSKVKNVVDVNGKKYDRIVSLEYGVFKKVSRHGKSYVNYIQKKIAEKNNREKSRRTINN